MKKDIIQFSLGHFSSSLIKGSPEGDGKDAAMRKEVMEVSGGAIVELASSYKPSSSKTTLTALGQAIPGHRKVMLARNKELRGKDLRNSTCQLIDSVACHPQFERFVVGDMPDVDSQFIEYLQEKNYPFTMYSTGWNPRINLDRSHSKSA